VQIKNYSEDVGEINADEEAFATSIAKKVMEDLAPYLAERRRRRRRVI
jgi:excinuclease UvrABC helicase subunit UvrB